MMKVTVFVLMALLCGQAAHANPIAAVVGGKVLATGAKVAGSVAGTGAGLAAGALSGLPVSVLKDAKVPEKFSAATCGGNGFCFPKYNSAEVEHPTPACPAGYTLNATALGQTGCAKQVYKKTQTCFRSTKCPADVENMKSEEVCLPKEVRSCLVGVLAVFQVHATLPFKILPALKTALVKAIQNPIVLPAIIAPQLPQLPKSLPEVNISLSLMKAPMVPHPANLIKSAATLAAAGQEVVNALVKGLDPMDLVQKSLLNINVTEVMNVVPQVNAWVSEQLQDLTNINNITEAISSKFPNCLYRCCKEDVTLDTTVALAKSTCSAGLKLNSVLGLCVGDAAYYSDCPKDFLKCDLPTGTVCVACNTTLGLDTCKVVGLLQHNLPKDQCP